MNKSLRPLCWPMNLTKYITLNSRNEFIYAYYFAFSYLVHNIQAMDGAYSFCLNGVLINFPNDYLKRKNQFTSTDSPSIVKHCILGCDRSVCYLWISIIEKIVFCP